MSLHLHAIGPVPDATARVARAAFKKGNRYLRLRDERGTLYTDELFAPLFSTHGQPATAPWRLALVTVVQCASARVSSSRPCRRRVNSRRPRNSRRSIASGTGWRGPSLKE